MPRLRVLAGPSLDSLTPITANSDTPHTIKSSLFEGRVVVHIKGFPDEDGNVSDSDYFSRPDRQGITWSIQVQGRFLKNYLADDILFGNTFDRPLKLPWGTSAALRFMHLVDPSLEHDLYGAQPWALSPLVSTMPHLIHTQHDPEQPLPGPFPPKQSIRDDLVLEHSVPKRGRSSSLTSNGSVTSSNTSGSSHDSVISAFSSNTSSSRSSVSSMSPKKRKPTKSAKARRTHFASASARQNVTFGPSDIITTDFCYGFLVFHPQLALRLPGGLTFDLEKWWDGQPVRFVCCERPRNGENVVSDGKVFWCVAIERADD